jgi:hypothetical protein
MEAIMAYSFLEVTNLTLREVNEVPMTDQAFLNARGLQQFTKESMNRAFYDISNESQKWPWKQVQGTGTADTEVRALTADVQWYDIEDSVGDRLTMDWNTFLLTDKDLVVNDPLVIPETANLLTEITYDYWIAKYRVEDFKGKRGVPKYVIRHPSGKFGVTPIPEDNYWVEYNVQLAAKRFTMPADVIPFPEEFINTLVARCKYYVWLFRENDTQANFALGEYREALASMKRILLSNKTETMGAT